MELRNDKINTVLEFEQYDDDCNQVFVTDTKRNVGGSFAACEQMGNFTDQSDTPLTQKQQDWLESAEVAAWLKYVGY